MGLRGATMAGDAPLQAPRLWATISSSCSTTGPAGPSPALRGIEPARQVRCAAPGVGAAAVLALELIAGALTAQVPLASASAEAGLVVGGWGPWRGAGDGGEADGAQGGGEVVGAGGELDGSPPPPARWEPHTTPSPWTNATNRRDSQETFQRAVRGASAEAATSHVVPPTRRQGQPEGSVGPHGHRPHRGDPRHLRPERPHPGGQGPGGAGSPALPAAAPGMMTG